MMHGLIEKVRLNGKEENNPVRRKMVKTNFAGYKNEKIYILCVGNRDSGENEEYQT
jgi:uncharacterized protein YunC (DUF1805 family)